MKNVKKKLSTSLVSDILDEMGHKNQILPIEIKPNFEKAKIFGKARIMTLKKIGKNEKYYDICKGLYFLESLNNGDVLVVANGFENNAFFGEIMSTLAKSKGVEGVVIEGCTRDKLETIKMKYPVFSKKNIARDIKKRGIVDKTDVKSTKIGKTTIRKGDYLLGDIDGVIVIPKKILNKTIKKSLEIFENEKSIKKAIIKGQSVKNLLNNFGEF